VTVVDTSVWIDYFRGIKTPEIVRLEELAAVETLAIGDLIIVEVLQGIADDDEFDLTKKRLTSLAVVSLGGLVIALNAAQNYRKLRSLGITVRKTIDTMIATYCILNGHELLYSDRDFDPFVKHLGLRSAMAGM
jgi:predicted nucleic acid-binding protein